MNGNATCFYTGDVAAVASSTANIVGAWAPDVGDQARARAHRDGLPLGWGADCVAVEPLPRRAVRRGATKYRIPIGITGKVSSTSYRAACNIAAGSESGRAMSTFLLPLILVIVAILLSSIRMAQEYQRAVIFRFGRVVGIRGPGLFLKIPFAERSASATFEPLLANWRHRRP